MHNQSCVHNYGVQARAYLRIAYLLRPFLRRGSNGRYMRIYGGCRDDLRGGRAPCRVGTCPPRARSVTDDPNRRAPCGAFRGGQRRNP